MAEVHYAANNRESASYKIDEINIKSQNDLFFSFKDIVSKAPGEVVICCPPGHLSLLFISKATDGMCLEYSEEEILPCSGYQYNVFGRSSRKLSLKFDRKGGCKLVLISMTVSFLERFLSDVVLAELRPYIEDASPGPVFRRFVNFLSPLQNSLLSVFTDDIVFTKLGGSFLKVKAEEALVAFLQDFEEGREMRNVVLGEGLSGRHQMKMHQVRDIILANLNDPPTLQNLARMVETNECYLKEHFKRVFGCTIFKYRQKILMEHSLRMLRDNDTKISEIARRVGYKHATHFCAAFKRHYGVSPRCYNRRDRA